MRTMSYKETWKQYVNTDPSAGATKCVTRRLKTVRTDGETYWALNKKPGDRWVYKLIIPSWWNHAKNKPTLKPDEVFEGVEWSRVGPRWVCDRCWRQGPKGDDWRVPADGQCECSNTDAWQRRGPHRGILSRHLETTVVRLGDDDGCEECHGSGRILVRPWEYADGTSFDPCKTCGGGGSAEAAREGFPGWTWEKFCSANFPGVPLDSKVARVHFERIDS